MLALAALSERYEHNMAKKQHKIIPMKFQETFSGA